MYDNVVCLDFAFQRSYSEHKICHLFIMHDLKKKKNETLD